MTVLCGNNILCYLKIASFSFAILCCVYGWLSSDSDNSPLDDTSILAGFTEFVTIWLNLTNIGDSSSCVKVNVIHNNPGIRLVNVTSFAPSANQTEVRLW